MIPSPARSERACGEGEESGGERAAARGAESSRGGRVRHPPAPGPPLTAHTGSARSSRSRSSRSRSYLHSGPQSCSASAEASNQSAVASVPPRENSQ